MSKSNVNRTRHVSHNIRKDMTPTVLDFLHGFIQNVLTFRRDVSEGLKVVVVTVYNRN